MFNSTDAISEIARENKIDLAKTALFFYEVYELQFDSGEWTHFDPEASFRTEVIVPETKVFEGYDVVTFTARTSPECSPCRAMRWRVKWKRTRAAYWNRSSKHDGC